MRMVATLTGAFPLGWHKMMCAALVLLMFQVSKTMCSFSAMMALALLWKECVMV